MKAGVSWLFLFSFFFFYCSPPDASSDLFSIQLKTEDGQAFDISEIKKNKASVFVFLSPDCPLSQKYSLTVKNQADKYLEKSIDFYLVFPGKLYKTEEIKNFLFEYELRLPSVLDSEKKLTKILGASVTPEAFLLDSAGKTIYSGAIDNWFIEPGKQREVITEHYLDEAIESCLKNIPAKNKQTKPVGCIIE